MTKVICLYGGPGSGKSTYASELFSSMKKQGHSVELVSEYAKEFVYKKYDSKENITKEEQLMIYSEQFRRERLLFNRVDYIITESPVPLSYIYSHINYKDELMDTIFINLVKLYFRETSSIEFENYYIKRKYKYISEGRFENEEQAKNVDEVIKNFLITNDIKFEEI